MNEVLMYFALKYEGNFEKIYNAVFNKEQVDIDRFFGLKKQMNHSCITAVDTFYPDAFKEMSSPPIVLFYTGNKSLLNKDLPIKELYLEDGTRGYSTIEPTMQKGKIVFDYVIACENHKNVEKLLEHVKEKGLPLKQQEKSIERNEKFS